ncbi:MAG TPA: porin [Stellaceae bacterium]|jgi:hypothetical protein|nr:porin [Stellaceae bacterium]
MMTKNLKGGVALGSLTAAIALLAGVTSAAAQPASGAGSFPQSFLIPGTNTSIAIYGTVKMSVSTNLGSQHVTDTSPSGIGATPNAISGLALSGQGAATSPSSVNSEERALHGGLRGQLKSTQIFFETRTPSDLGEIKTVVMMNFGSFGLQSNYIGKGPGASTNSPSSGAGNNEMPRIQFAYGTLGPWLFGQYNSNFVDPLLINPDIGDQSQIGPLQTRNVRRPQIRYTYLAGNGLSLSASLETNTYTNLVGTSATGSIGAPLHEDSTDTGGITNYPSFNVGASWSQPWGHLMFRAGVAEDEVRNTTNSPGRNFNLKKTGWALAAGVMLNTWGKDQWRGQVHYAQGADTYLTDMGDAGFIDTTTGSLVLIKELALNTSYIHRFSPNWRTTAEFGIGWFDKPSNAANLSAIPTATSNAALAGLEKRHIQSGLSLTYSPIPGRIDIGVEWDHWERSVQVANTTANGNRYSAHIFFYW